jgi:CDP-diacylglycerol--serine O-phosphatidyltransferase
MGKLGWIAAFVYCAGTALRLARFNTNIDVVDKRWFQGMPSPAAAALVAGFVWVSDDFGIERVEWIQYIAWTVTMYAGVTMVTNVPFYAFKDINFRKSVPFWAVLAVVAAMTVISIKPPVILFLLFVAYGLHGYVMLFLRRRKRAPIA